MRKKLIVNKSDAGLRVDAFLAKTVPSFSRTRIQSLIAGGKVLVNGVEKKASFRLKDKDCIVFDYEQTKEKLLLQPYKFDVKIIYEDESFIVVDKPTNLTVHPPTGASGNTLLNALIYMKKKLSQVNPLRCGVVHRLDKATSGVMALAKTDEAHLYLLEQFKQRAVKKEYRAIVWGEVKGDSFNIDLPVGRDAHNRLKMKVGFIHSKDAFTEMRVLKRFKDSTFLSVAPRTGRTHQIRVHLKFLGYPIVGDKKYGIKDEYDNLFLHAYRLGFYHPTLSKFLEFEAPLPPRFMEFIAKREDV